MPGNGLFLTSTTSTVLTGYTYTGLRRWSMDANFTYSAAHSQAGLVGDYSDTIGLISISRQLSRGFHAIASFSAHRYESPSYKAYNRIFYIARIGFGFTPGDVPLRIW